jgi:hypothetical protein
MGRLIHWIPKDQDDRPPDGAVHQEGDVYLVSDVIAATLAVDDVVADADVESLVSERFDLPSDHPLYGQRVLKHVPSGSKDLTPDDLKLVKPESE